MELTEEQQLCLAGIAKCDAFLQNWDMRGFEVKKDSIRFCESTDEVPPQKVVETFRGLNRELRNEDPDICLVIFFANAKCGFIMRLVEIQERENAVSMA